MAILITAGAEAAAYRLGKLIKPDCLVVFADYLPLPRYNSTERKFVNIPEGGSAAYAHTLLALCLDLEVTEVYPLRKSELVPLAESRQLFSEYGIEVMVPERNLLKSFTIGSIVKHGQLVIVKEGRVVKGGSLVNNSFPDCSGIFLVDTASNEPKLYTAD